MKTRSIIKRRTARFISDPMSFPKIRRDIRKREGAIAAIAMKGDMFWNNGRTREFSTAKGLQEGYKSMDRTFHDLDHGANPNGGLHIRIEDIVGYHDFTEYNPVSKEMVIYIYPEEKMPKYETWHAFMDLNEKAGMTPNISVEYMSNDEQIPANELAGLVDYKEAGFKDDDLIWVERSYRFLGAASVNMGACSDEDGCGIIAKDEEITDSIGIACNCDDTDTMIREENKMGEETKIKAEEQVEDVKQREIDDLKARLVECGNLQKNKDADIEQLKSRVSELEPPKVDDEKVSLEERVINLETQLKEAEEKLSKPVSRKTVDEEATEIAGIRAINMLRSKGKIDF